MPLFGEYIQNGDERVCATKNWSSLPPEAFDINFMQGLWPTLPPADQAAAEYAAVFFITTHWGPPAAPPADLAHVARPIDFADEAFSGLGSRTTRVEFEVPKTDFEKLGWRPTFFPVPIPPDPNPEIPHRLRGWYIRGDGVREDDGDDEKEKRKHAQAQHPLIVISSGFPYSINRRSQRGRAEERRVPKHGPMARVPWPLRNQ